MTITRLAALFAFNISALMAFMFFILYFFYKADSELKYLAILFFSTGLYATGQVLLEGIKTPGAAIFWHKFETMGLILMSPAWFNFSFNFIRKKKIFLNKIINILSVLLLIILYPTELIIKNETYEYGGEFLQGRENWLYYGMLLLLGFSIVYGYVLILKSTIKDKNLHSYNVVLLCGTAIAILFGLHDLLGIFNIYLLGIETTLFEYGLYIMSLTVIYSWIIARGFKEKEVLKEIFNRYVSYPVMKDEGIIKITDVSVEIEVSILFADIRGFTAISEKLESREIVDMLNKYYTEMTAIAEEFGGIVDKFIGDNVMVVFGLNEKHKNHPLLAARAACAMRDKMIKTTLGSIPEKMSIGIGINSGKVIMGSLGSYRRMEYTVIGETVNIAAYLQELAFRDQILITSSVFEHVEKYVNSKKMDEIFIKDKNHPVLIYELESIKQY